MTDKHQTSRTMSPHLWAHVEAIRATGLYGESTSSVLRMLVMQGIRQAIRDRLIETVKR